MGGLKKKGWLSLVMVTALSTLAAGCSLFGDGGSSDEGTITFWHGTTDVEKEALEEIVKKFNEKNPETKVKPVYIAQQGEGQNEKLLAAIAGGHPPDVAYFDRFEIGSWAEQGSLTEITEQAKKAGIDNESYYDYAIAEATYKGKLYGLPMDSDSRLLFYNKDHFKEAGLDPEKPPKSIAELEKAAKKLTVKKGNRFEQIGFVPWYGQGWLYTWGWAFGGDFYDEKSGKVIAHDPKVVESLQWMADYAKKYGIEDVTAFTDSAGSAAESPFLTGQLSMMVNVPTQIGGIQKYKPDLNYGVAPIPTPTGDNFTTWAGGFSFVIPKGSKHEKEAWEFMKFAAGPEGQEIYSKMTGNFASIQSINEELYKDDPIKKEFVDSLLQAHHRPVISEGSLLWNELTKARDLAIREKNSPEKLLKAVSNKVNDALNK